MHGALVLPGEASGVVTRIADPKAADVERALAGSAPFWLDLPAADADVLALLRDTFGFHPLAVEDAEHFGQRPKLDRYDSFAMLVAYGFDAAEVPVEVHCFYSHRFLVTVHRQGLPNYADIVGRLTRSPAALPEPLTVLYRILDALVDSYVPILDGMDEAVDDLEDAILRKPTDAQLGELFRLKRRLVTVRRLSSQQRDSVLALLDDDLPGMPAETEHYYRDLYDHLVRASQAADTQRELLTSVLDTHMSSTSNRLNIVMKQLAIIATIFLPLSFLTGFLGQNFGWMVDHIGGAWAFWSIGVGLQIVVAAALLAMFRRKGWLGGSADT